MAKYDLFWQSVTHFTENVFLKFIVEYRSDGQQSKKVRNPEQTLLNE